MLGRVNNTTGSAILQGSMKKWKNELKAWEILSKNQIHSQLLQLIFGAEYLTKSQMREELRSSNKDDVWLQPQYAACKPYPEGKRNKPQMRWIVSNRMYLHLSKLKFCAH